jgi:mono/diheme cytochrome c family protein
MKTLAYLLSAACLAALAGCASAQPVDKGLQAYSPDEVPTPVAAPTPKPAPAPVAAARPSTPAPAPAASAVNVAAAKAILETNCAACHAPNLATDSRHTQAEWDDILDSMVARGASLSDDEHKTLLAYLAASYGR